MIKDIDVKKILLPEDFVNHWNENMSDEEYHSAKMDTFLGSSSAKIAIDSMAAFYDYFYLRNRPAETKDQIIGKRVHMALLEPEKFKQRLVVEPKFGDGNMKKTVNQVARAEWRLDLNKDAVVVTQEELDQVIGIAEAVLKHDQGLALIKDGRTELAGFARCPITGIGIKIKCDFLSYDLTRFSDYKTTKSTKKRSFMNDVFIYWRYDFQLAFYLYGIKLISNKRPEIISLLASEKKRPYEPAAYYFTDFELEKAEAEVIEVLKRIRKCIDENVWPFRQQEIERATVPRSLQYDDDQENDEGES